MSKDKFVKPAQSLTADGEISSKTFRCVCIRRFGWCIAVSGILFLIFHQELFAWYQVAMASDLHSHVILIPAVTIYLLLSERRELAWDSRPAPAIGIILVFCSWLIFYWSHKANLSWSEINLIALRILAFVMSLWGIGFLFVGRQWMRSAIFPMGFLLFMVPLPDFVVGYLEHILMVMSAALAEAIFSIGGIPVFRSGQVLELPGTVLEVAKECSGIRSSWVLLITSILAAYLFLPTLPRKMLLVAVVFPLGVLRNAVRIFVIGWLCVNYGHEMIDSWIHHKGGPVFFAISLVPLFVMAWWLRRRLSDDLSGFSEPKNSGCPQER